MTITRDWITVAEHAKSVGMTRQGVHLQILRGKFQLPYVRTGGDKGTVLIYSPNAETQKTEAKSQANLPGATCDLAGNR